MRIEHRHPWLIADLEIPMRVLSWAPYRAGLVTAQKIAWREVRNADLTPELDVAAWLSAEMEREGLQQAVGFITSRNAARHHTAEEANEDATATCPTTVGLGNVERVGRRVVGSAAKAGTINILSEVRPALSQAGLLEAMSIATEARTLAVIEAGRRVPAGIATGTGTDCIAIASPEGDTAYAGKHTGVGEALGRAVDNAVSQGIAEWVAERG